MSDLIRVDYERLEKLAAVFGQQSENVTQLLQQMQGSMNPLLAGGWMGQGSDAFFGEMEAAILPAVQRLIEALSEANQVTNQIVGMMQQADEEASAAFRNGGSAGSGGISLGLGGLEGLINGIGFGGSGAGPSSLGNPFLGGRLPGGGLGGGLFNGDLFGGGASGSGFNSNDYGIPRDWLSGVTNSLNGYIGDNYNDYGIPKDWLSEVQGGSASGGASGGAGTAGGGAGEGATSGGSSGGSGGSEPASSGSGGSGSGSSPTTDVRDPFGRGNVPRSFGGSTGTAVASETAQAAGLRYQSLGAVGGGAGTAAAGGAAAGSGAAAAAGNQSNLGLSMGVAAASPFLALLGKAIKNSRDDD